jgi:hypothetical protein
VPFLKYPYSGLRERVAEALRETLPEHSSDDDTLSFWINVKPAGVREIRLIVVPNYTGCGVKDRV